jgi:hypothetical protein
VATPLTQRAKDLYWRTRPIQDVFAFFAGFAWDWVALDRIDSIRDDLFLLAYLGFLALFLVLKRRVAIAPERWPRLAPHAAWIDYGIQFCFGSLYAAYVVFYFKSASWLPSMVYVALLVGLLVANQWFEHRLRAEGLRLATFCLCVFSFLLFFVPVVFQSIGPWAFAAAAIGSLATTMALGWAVLQDGRRLAQNVGAWTAMVAGLWVASKLGLIPPVPLALLDGGIYHRVERTGDGYAVTWDTPEWWHVFTHDDRVFHYRAGDKVFCYTAIFVPRGAEFGIVHVWQQWDEVRGAWVESDRIPFDVVGGRGGGYRGFTHKRNVAPGEWRVRVETEDGRELGDYAFSVVDDGRAPRFRTATLE